MFLFIYKIQNIQKSILLILTLYLILPPKMPLRKIRIPSQGTSNRKNQPIILFGIHSDPASTNVQLKSPSESSSIFLEKSSQNQQKNILNNINRQKLKRISSNQIPEFQHKHLEGNDEKVTKKKTQKKLKKFYLHESATNLTEKHLDNDQNIKKIVTSLRNHFKIKSNLKKITKAWGFQNKGFITAQRFQEIVSQNMGIPITSAQSKSLINQASHNQEGLDITGFLNILYKGKSIVKPDINVFNIEAGNLSQQKQERQAYNYSIIKKIKALNQTTKYNDYQYEQILKKQAKYFQEDYLNKKSLTRNSSDVNTSNLPKSNEVLFKERSIYSIINTIASSHYKFKTTKSQTIDFTPTQFYDKNQQKSRYGATLFDLPKKQSVLQNKRQRIICEKEKVMDTLNQERDKIKCRNERKLQKIRECRERQKQNIQTIDKMLQNRSLANMKKTREENLAYNYVHFLQNQWK